MIRIDLTPGETDVVQQLLLDVVYGPAADEYQRAGWDMQTLLSALTKLEEARGQNRADQRR